MSDLLFARWTCAECKESGVVSGERSDTSTQPPEDPAHFNCYYCQGTVSTVLPEGLDRWQLRVEGVHPMDPAPACPSCQASAEAFWDERGSPLLACPQCGHAVRLPEPVPDPLAFEVLLESRDERIERRRVEGGWEFRSFSFYKEGSRLRTVKKQTELFGFEADPGRPLAQIFKEIRAEHARLREEAALPPAEPAAEAALLPTTGSDLPAGPPPDAPPSRTPAAKD